MSARSQRIPGSVSPLSFAEIKSNFPRVFSVKVSDFSAALENHTQFSSFAPRTVKIGVFLNFDFKFSHLQRNYSRLSEFSQLFSGGLEENTLFEAMSFLRRKSGCESQTSAGKEIVRGKVIQKLKVEI